MTAGMMAVLAFVVPAVARAENPPVGVISVTITNLRNDSGEVLISLYNKAEGFPRDRSTIIRSAAVPAEATGGVSIVFEDLPYGDYAIAVLHDEDSSLDMTYGKLHLPKEGYCFSNNIKVRFRPPKFKKAKFTLDRELVGQILSMRY
jgi:uncharacterized protein (DUF2141 family)